jgi:hypothetical protein
MKDSPMTRSNRSSKEDRNREEETAASKFINRSRKRRSKSFLCRITLLNAK